jgi:hypothetical protein
VPGQIHRVDAKTPRKLRQQRRKKARMHRKPVQQDNWRALPDAVDVQHV